MSYETKVRAFGRHMLTQFEANSDRGGYRHGFGHINHEHSLQMLDEAHDRLRRAMTGELAPDEDQRAAIREASADVANCSLICAEVCNAIQYRPEDMIENNITIYPDDAPQANPNGG